MRNMQKLSGSRLPAAGLPIYFIGLCLLGSATSVGAGVIADAPLNSYLAGGHDFLVIFGNSDSMKQGLAGETRLSVAKAAVTQLVTDPDSEMVKAVGSGQTVGLGLMTYGGSSSSPIYQFGSATSASTSDNDAADRFFFSNIYPSYYSEFYDPVNITISTDTFGAQTYTDFSACNDAPDTVSGTKTGNLQGFFYKKVDKYSHPYCLPRTYLRAYKQSDGSCTGGPATKIVCGHVDGRGVLANSSPTPGMGMLRVPIEAIPTDSAAAANLSAKLATAIDSADTVKVVDNSGNMVGSRAIEGALLTACDYFNTDFYGYSNEKKSTCYRGYAPGASPGGGPLPPSNQFTDAAQGFAAFPSQKLPPACDASVILVTDGPQNTTADGLFYTPDWSARERRAGSSLDPVPYASPKIPSAVGSAPLYTTLTDPAALALHNLYSTEIDTYVAALGVGSNPPGNPPNCPSASATTITAALTPAQQSNCPRLQMDMLAARGKASTVARAYYPKDLQSLKSTFNDMVSEKLYAARSGFLKFSSTATSSANLLADSLIFQAQFTYYSTSGWTGDLQAFPIDAVAVKVGSSIIWSAADKLNKIKTPSFMFSDRKLYSFNPDAMAPIVFKWASLGASQKAAINHDSFLPAWVQGDPAKEGNPYKKRSRRLLGDIVNSDPVYVGGENFGYRALPTPEGNTYVDFLQTKAARPAMIYVGANDGMLHGFNVGTSPSYSDGGVERFAYVPNAVIGPPLVKYAAPALGGTYYPHVYTVDGSPTVGDAYLNNGNSIQTQGQGKGWNTVLVGGTGAGAKAIFALDVTSPSNFGVGNVMWEISDTDSRAYTPNSADMGDIHGNLGYTLAQPAIVRLNDGQWAAIVANGYNSANGKAVLFVFNLKDGSLIKTIDTGAAGNTAVPKNGLSTPIVVDIDGNRTADYVYAGDLLGNLWKFDLSGTDPASWGSAYATGGGQPAPLFVACTASACTDSQRQPITAKPNVGAAGGTSQGDGVMVYFGTGKYFELGDNIVPAAPQTQTFYALHDAGAPINGRGNLQTQSITGQYRSSINGEEVYLRTSTGATVDYLSRSGWYMDLVTPPTVAPSGPLGERVLAFPLLRNGRVIFTTWIPSSSNSCTAGGQAWLMELNALNGSRLAAPPWDVNKDGNFNNDMVNNAAPSGMRMPPDFSPKTQSIVSVNGWEMKLPVGVRESVDTTTATPSRESWREIQ